MKPRRAPADRTSSPGYSARAGRLNLDSLIEGKAAGAGPKVAPPTLAKLSVIVPAHNERDTIMEALRRVKAAPGEKEILVVDDASTDGTLELLEADRDIRL